MPIVFANEDGSYTQPRTRSNARLVVLSEVLLTDEISSIIGLPPDVWWLRGEFGSHPNSDGRRRSRPQPFNGWELRSRLLETARPDEHLFDLLERLDGVVDRVASFVTDSRIRSATLYLGHHTDNMNPVVDLTDALVKRLAALETGVVIDIYAAPEDAAGLPSALPPLSTTKRAGEERPN